MLASVGESSGAHYSVGETNRLCFEEAGATSITVTAKTTGAMANATSVNLDWDVYEYDFYQGCTHLPLRSYDRKLNSEAELAL